MKNLTTLLVLLVSASLLHATTVNVPLIFDGFVDKFPDGGPLNSAITGNPSFPDNQAQFQSGFEERIVMEFDLSGVVLGTVSATLTFIETVDSGHPTFLNGYVGDGSFTTTDFLFNNRLNNGNVINDGIVNTTSVNVTTFIQGLLDNNDSVAGFNIEATTLGARYFTQSDDFGVAAVLTLTDADVVPEPHSLLLLLVSTTMIFQFRKK